MLAASLCYRTSRRAATASIFHSPISKSLSWPTSPATCAQPRPGGWCTYSLYADTRAVTPDDTVLLPAKAVDPDKVAAAINFSLSPDGQWRPMPNHDDGQSGLFDLSDDHL